MLAIYCPSGFICFLYTILMRTHIVDWSATYIRPFLSQCISEGLTGRTPFKFDIGDLYADLLRRLRFTQNRTKIPARNNFFFPIIALFWTLIIFILLIVTHIGFGGLEVACWPLVPQVRGFKPGRIRRIFQGEKILSTLSFGRGSKAVCPYRKRRIRCFRLNLSAISRPIVPPFVTRIPRVLQTWK
jgi:hypothetical protein